MYRVWDKEEKRMIYFSNVEKEDYCLALTLEGGLYDIAYGRADFGPVTDSFIVMFDTQKKDKNGQLIYEGDILNTQFNELAIIERGEGVACVGLVLRNVRDKTLRTVFTWENYEIVGNIYENPELNKNKIGD